MPTISEVNSKLSALKQVSDFTSVQSVANTTASAVLGLKSTSLGTLLGEAISGVEALNTSPQAKATVALLTKNLTGLASQIVKDVSSSKSDLDAITGTSVDDGFLNVVVASATAEGVQAAINQIATPSDSQMKTIVQNITPEQFANQITDIVTKDFSSLASELTSAVSVFGDNYNNLINASGTGSILQKIILTADSTPLAEIENIGVPVNKTQEVFDLLSNGDLNGAVRFSQSFVPDMSVNELERRLSLVSVSLSDQIRTSQAAGSSTMPLYDVSSKNNTFTGASTPPEYFDTIATKEQLLIEMIKSPREVTELVFFGHEQSENQQLTAREIHDQYSDTDGIPFHYVILSNGNVQRGRPLSKDGNYSETRKKYSIGVVCPHGIGQPCTVAQGRTARMLIDTFYEVWPGGQLYDGYELGISEVATGVNIAAIRTAAKKINYGSGSTSISTAQLISAAQGNI